MNRDETIEIPISGYIELFKKTTGAFSVAEMIALANVCKEVPEGVFCELGTHRSKSTVASIYGLPNKGTYFLIEPEFKDDEWYKWTELNVKVANKAVGKKIKFELLATYSTEFISIQPSFSYVFVNSGVHDDLVMEEVKMLEDKMIPQGIIAFHDFKNQFTAVERAYNYLLSTGKYEVVFIDWPAILKYVTENNLEEGNNSWHLYPELGHPPNFVGALRRK